MAFISRKQYEEEIASLKREYKTLKDFNDEMHESKTRALIKENSSLKKEVDALKKENEALRSNLAKFEKMHNERGAGRKRKVTDDMVKDVIDLYNEGLSLSKIAMQITTNTNTIISKSTVHKIVKSSQN